MGPAAGRRHHGALKAKAFDARGRKLLKQRSPKFQAVGADAFGGFLI